ncbi:MAG: tetratricopeptide repeat protein [Planctomycetes bacterium]|jgi:tetratricopeptide (TPR) repeat protein|nr:tetratricopeptide repeat protein [Planctomycetota bacterium]
MADKIEKLRAAVGEEPRNPALRVQLGDALLEAGRYADASAEYQDAAILAPGDAAALYGLGRVALRHGDYHGACSFFRQAGDARPDWAAVFFQWAAALRGLGDVRGSRDLQKFSFELGVKEVKDRNRRARELLSGGRCEDALAELRAARAISPRSAITHVNTGVALQGMRRPDAARRHFRLAADLGPDLFEAQYNFGLQLFHDGDLEGSLARFRRASELRPEDPFSHNAVGNVLLRLGRPREAHRAFLDSIERNPNFPEALNGAAEAALDLDRPAEAAGLAREALELKPTFARARSNLGRALERQGDPDAAAREYEAALRTDPRHANAYLRLAKIRLERRDAAAAVDLLEDAVRRCEPGFDVRFLLGRAHIEAGTLWDASKALVEALILKPDSFDAWRLLAETHAALGQPEEAVRAFARAVLLKPSDVRTWIRIAEIHAAAENRQGAVEALCRGVRANPGNFEAAGALAAGLQKRGDLPGVVRVLETAAETGKPSAEFLETLASLALDAGLPGRAADFAGAALAAGGEEADLRMLRGKALSRAGLRDAAVEEYRKAARARPQLAEAHLEIGKALVQEGKHVEGAASLQAGLALGAGKRDLEALCFLGLALSETGKAQGAIRVLSRALEIDPACGPAHNVLASACLAAGDLSSAWAHVALASEGKSPVDPETVEKIRKALQG